MPPISQTLAGRSKLAQILRTTYRQIHSTASLREGQKKKGLYGTGGYFSTAELIFKSDPLPFQEMLGETDYKRHLSRLYEASDVGWTTPVECFKPWYGRAIAHYVLSQMTERQDELVIYEIGGGRGRLVTDFLGFVEEFAPELAKKIEYNVIDISKAMYKDMRNKLESTTGAQVHLHNLSALDWKKRDERPCFVIALEVLSNFPSDQIKVSNGSVNEVLVDFSEDDGLLEVERPLQDASLKRALEVADFVGATMRHQTSFSSWMNRLITREKASIGFIPTNIVKLFDMLNKCLPQSFSSQMIFPDFDRFQTRCAGYCGPIVQMKQKGKTQAFSSYLAAATKRCDVMFPLDFETLREAYQNTTGKTATIMGTEDFMMRYAEVDKTMTLSGYNPLLEDYENTKFLLS